MLQNKTALFIGSVILIFVAMAVVAVIDRTKSDSTDVRARASSVNTLQFKGTFGSTDPSNGNLLVHDLYMADESRAGDAKNLGTWTVTPPVNFNSGSLAPGTTVIIGIEPKTFLATSHTLTALSITAEKK